MTATITFEELSVTECRSLLSGRHFGRLAVVVDGQPLIFPVNYRFESDALVFVTAPGTKLTATDLARVAFEVDDIDDEGRTGWSVLVQGTGYEITAALDSRALHLRRLQVQSAVAEDGVRTVEIEATTITGRRSIPTAD